MSMIQPNFRRGFSYREEPCRFEGGSNLYIEFGYDTVAKRLAGDLIWAIDVEDQEAQNIIKEQIKILEMFLEEQKVDRERILDLVSSQRQKRLAKAIKESK